MTTAVSLFFSSFYLFIFCRVIIFAIGMFTYVAHFDRKVEIYIATKLFQFAFRKDNLSIFNGKIISDLM